MALLLNAQGLGTSFGAQTLFSGVQLTVEEGERLGLIGPNGAGKSTLLKILAGLEAPDEGTCAARKLLRLRYIAQHPALPEQESVRGYLQGCLKAADLGLDEAERAGRLATMLGVGGFSDTDARDQTPIGELSGGWRRRLALLGALAARPDVLLLDEPTNHLDLEGVLWLERLLAAHTGAVVMVSHDRAFLERVVFEVAELNPVYPNGIFRVHGSYSRFLEEREAWRTARQQHREGLASQVRREVEWLRQGAKARTTKAKARIDSAGRLIEELADMDRRRPNSPAQIDFQASGRKTRLLMEAEGVEVCRGDAVIFTDLNLRLVAGQKLGIVGANGSGKSTLLRLLTGELTPSRGRVQRAAALRTVYFDQEREQLDPRRTLRRTLAPDSDAVVYGDTAIHVASWARRFLFRSDQLEMPVGRLSGGEQARLLIARLMLQPADLLLLDEPTNDLDIPTLEVLEESLSEFAGALVLVTHDRMLLDRVSDSLLSLDIPAGGHGARRVTAFADLPQWEADRAAREVESKQAARGAGEREREAARPAERRRAPRLSYLEAREWEGMEARILAAEEELQQRQRAVDDPAIMSHPEKSQAAYDALLAAQSAVEALYARWAELEAKQQPTAVQEPS